MKKDTERDNLLDKQQNILNPITISMEALSEEELIIKSMKIIEDVKKGKTKSYPIDTLWDEI